MTLALSTVAPAYAGTLTSASFTASTPYTYTSAQNTRYDYGFTTATTSTLSKVTMSAPAGTGGSNRYLALNSVAGNYANTPDSVANSVTGDIDIRALVSSPTAMPATFMSAVAKWTPASQESYGLGINSGGLLQINVNSTGSGNPYVQASSAITFTPNVPRWLRATAQLNNGSGSSVYNFYTSSDGSAWTQLGSTKTRGSSSVDFRQHE